MSRCVFFVNSQSVQCCSPSQSSSPFASLPLPTVPSPENSSDTALAVVAGPFAPHPVPPSVPVQHSPSADPLLGNALDRYVNIVTAKVNDGRFSHKVVVPACALYVGNRTLTFQGSATTVRHLLLPLFQDWTFATLASLPSVSQVGEPQPPLAPTLPVTFQSLRTATSVPNDTNSLCRLLHTHNPPALAHPTGAKVVRFVGSPSKSRLHKLKSTAWFAQLPLHPFHILRLPHPLPPVLPLRQGAHSQASAGHLPSPSHPVAPPPPPSPDQLCSLLGCTSPVPRLCSTTHCDSHCHGRRCSHHRLSVPQPIPPVTPSHLP